MNISKVFFLTAFLTISLHCNKVLPSSPEQQDKQQIFDFALMLQEQNDPQAEMIAVWLEQHLLSAQLVDTDKLTIILNADLPLLRKIDYLIELKNITESNQIQEEKEEQKKTLLSRLAAFGEAIKVPTIIIASEAIGRTVGQKIVNAVFTE